MITVGTSNNWKVYNLNSKSRSHHVVRTRMIFEASIISGTYTFRTEKQKHLKYFVAATIWKLLQSNQAKPFQGFKYFGECTSSYQNMSETVIEVLFVILTMYISSCCLAVSPLDITSHAEGEWASCTSSDEKSGMWINTNSELYVHRVRTLPRA